MRRRLSLLVVLGSMLIAAAVFLVGQLHVAPLSAQTGLTVTMRVSDTLVTFAGWSAPNTLITIVQGGSIVGSTTTDADGFFTHTLLAQVEGVQTFQLTATHTESGTVSDPLEYSLYVPPKTETTLSNIVMPVLAVLPSNQMLPNETLFIQGWSAPGSQVVVTFGTITFPPITVGASGTWLYPIAGAQLTPGTVYPVSAVVTTNGTDSQSSSLGTVSVGFLVIPTATPSPTVTPKPTQPLATATPQAAEPTEGATALVFSATATPVPPSVTPGFSLPEYMRKFDVANNNVLSSAELEAIVQLWYQATWPVEQDLAICDLNSDVRCDIFDFSILMFWIDQHLGYDGT